MIEWTSHILNSGQTGITVLIAVFVIGMVSVFSCGCNYAIVGVVAGYTGTIGSSGRTKVVIYSGLFFLIGNIISMAILGALLGYASQLISASFGNYWKIAAGLISIFFGLYTMDILPFKIPAISISRKDNNGSIISAIIFGFTIGGLASVSSLCCNSFFPVVMAATFIKGSVVWGMVMLVVFSIGFALPLSAAMIGLGFGLGKISKTVERFGTILKYIGGIALVAMGFYFLITL